MWCKDINWKKVHKKELIPPFKPFWNKSNFDPEYTSMPPILEDDEPLIALQDSELEINNRSEYLDDYSNRINKHKNDFIMRQPSIEFYTRENNTFRGYSFLEQSNQSKHMFENEAGLFFCLPDSKDNSF